MALDDAITELLTRCDTQISALKRVPTEPPETNADFPFLVGYPGPGTYTSGPPGVLKGLHSVILELHIKRRDLAESYDDVMAVVDLIPKAIYDGLPYTYLSTITEPGIESSGVIPMNWASVDTLGVRYTAHIKVETTT